MTNRTIQFVTDFEELSLETGKHVSEFVKNEPDKYKEKVLDYLRRGTDAGIRCSLIFDYVLQQQTDLSIFLYTDGEYDWTSEDIYYYEHYNIPLKKEFVKKILEL